MNKTPTGGGRHWRKKARRLLLIPAVVLCGPLSFFALDRMYPFPEDRLLDALATQSSMIRAADGSLLSWTVDADENWRLPVKLSSVSPHLVAATIAVEDKRFRSHPGVDVVAAVRAGWQNVAGMRRVSGASTITMQTIRLLWPRPRRWSSKLVEAFRAIQLERLAGKDGVLELYFNLAPYGGNVVGAEAAARRYFGKSSFNLSLGEAALLAGIPQSPARLDPRRHPARAGARRRQVLQRLRDDGMIDGGAFAAAAAEDFAIRVAGSAESPGHFAAFVRSRSARTKGVVETTLLPDRQEQAERLAAEWIRDNPGVSGPAFVAMRVADGAVVAYVGNAGGKARPDWQVDAARMRRQPGSLLKPFLFAALAERGEITPSSMVLDTPGFWPGYAPENMDREWRGEISAAAALAESRNLPAVRQLSRLGPAEFARTLHALGLEAGDPGRQGLAMALGVKEQNLLSLVTAYAALARLGEWRPAKLVNGDGGGEIRRIWSPEASWLAIAALSRPPGRRKPALAWKTGTSWNQQDAWAIAFSPEWVVGVWCGRMRSGGGAWVSGGANALPLALSGLSALSEGGMASWETPEGIEYESMCAASGLMPGWRCGELVESPFSRRHPPALACSRCGPESPTNRAPGVQAADAVHSVPARRPLQIAEPKPGSVFVMPGSSAAGEPVRIHFRTAGTGGSGRLYWFLDGTLLAGADAGESVPWTAIAGSHRIVAVDDSGRRASAAFSVVEMGGGAGGGKSMGKAGP